ncbi:hypothetical protein ACFP1H_00040 [Secundilactobacillus hailunensis]|uniref:Uncharacterized protein n=1 Tax=Secundilactobacillus hailunensis TaxID=2559923 RepID=A0ABW1T6L9_9LACO|nr:hypothetical protein [Secundilactobacillus hailunensis]
MVIMTMTDRKRGSVFDRDGSVFLACCMDMYLCNVTGETGNQVGESQQNILKGTKKPPKLSKVIAAFSML